MECVVILNPPSREEGYLSRDEMGGMGQKNRFGTGLSSMLSMVKSSMIHLPVMDLVYLATIESRKNYVVVIDAQNDDLPEFEVLKRIESIQPDRVIMAVSSCDLAYEMKLAWEIKSLTEAEIQTVGETITYLDVKSPFKHIKVDAVGIEPDWSLFNIKNFNYYPFLSDKPIVSVIASKGCPFNCAYCSYTKNQGAVWKPVPLKQLEKEICFDVFAHKVQGIVFRDPLFSFDRQRTFAICRMLEPLDIGWTCETRPELLDEELIMAMAKSGCRGISMGIESTDPKILSNVGRRPIDLARVKMLVAFAEYLGIRTVLFFILGLPGETKASIQASVDFAIEANPSHADFKVATPYPGTRLYEQAKRNGWIKGDNFSGYSGTMNAGLSSEYLEEQCSSAFKRFYFRKDYIIRELKRKGLLRKMSMLWECLW